MAILVTGAASGIGAALMERLGQHAIGLDRAGAQIICDLADPGAIQRAAAAAPAPLHGIAHVAGLPGTRDAASILAVNTLAPMRLTEALLPKLADGAAIVAVSSVTALRCTLPSQALDAMLDDRCRDPELAAMPGTSAYELSKALLNRWVMRMATLLRARHIRVNSLSPGPVETPILADFRASMGEGRIAAASSMVGRHGYPAEIAAVAAFLLGPSASWVNGTDVRVDGGFHAVRALEAQG